MILDNVAIDRARIPRSYRDYLRTLKEMGELIEINDEVDWYLELGAIFRRTAATLSCVRANTSKTKPAKLLAVFVVDTNETELTIPFGN